MESQSQPLYLVFLGMLVIDNLYFEQREPILEVVGGSGAYWEHLTPRPTSRT